MPDNDQQLETRLRERFAQLPKALQAAIRSTEVEAKLRTLSDAHKLHLDQWEALENEVMLALLGFQPIEKLEENIKNEAGVSPEEATAIARDINAQIFEPIRQELERETEAPAQEPPAAQPPAAQVPAPPPVAPATPPSPPPQGEAIRAPLSSSYQAQQASHERKTIEGDPYREQLN